MTESANTNMKQPGPSYFIDAENAAEMARLTNQDRIMTRAMGGLISERSDLSIVHDVLDIACGPGGWSIDMANAFPDKQVTGVDISQLMIEYAKYQASVQGVHNVSFSVKNILKPLGFPDSSFDLVNARLISGFMPQRLWPVFMRECLRITRPGGSIRITEPERTISTSPAVEQLNDRLARAMHKAGQSVSPSELQFGVTPLLRRYLQEAGYQHIQSEAHVLDSSAGSDEYMSQYQNSMVFFKLLQSFMVNIGVVTKEEVERLYQEALEEMKSPSYCALWYFLTIWGEKPR
jgi:ubiquinone/menaquinone biosynthesis C-methylase UbiE